MRPKREASANSGILWSGPSALGGGDIVVIVSGLTKPSDNEKTGDMIQTWIMRADAHPAHAVREKQDGAVCGDCVFAQGSGCYVNTGFAPAALWRAYSGGQLARLDKIERRAPVRLGSYGDPAAVPVEVWEELLPDRWTGFTHQWRRPEMERFREFCMASTEDTTSTFEAQLAGWRTFRVRPRGAPLLESEVDCPNTNLEIKCADCSLCRGNRLAGAKSVSIEAHGSSVGAVESASRWAEMINSGSLVAW